ncbi:Catechol 2,3-dioxygenase [Fictibacillus solisalsi]|uniref:Catechol 2,3-dioxygenase n=1 Tax=Fictibacillus solisalsi TaxID=459525 RepID=A0A1G9TQW8_9BACL|nr:VOC family protein [Fictibacillus solisalsi]SDM49958.1 Catechol 2,3-dioxygenase [Fictibacillus solisalsi]
MTAITHIGLAVPDLEGAIKWYEDVLGFTLIAGPYTFDAKTAGELNMTNDLLGAHIKKMKNAHLLSENQVGIELFEFVEPKMQKTKNGVYSGFFHVCIIAEDLEQKAEEIVASGGKRRSDRWNTWKGKPYHLIYCEDPYGNIIELYSHSTAVMYANKDE